MTDQLPIVEVYGDGILLFREPLRKEIMGKVGAITHLERVGDALSVSFVNVEIYLSGALFYC